MINGLGELGEDVLVDDWIEITAQHVDDPPVTDVHLVWNWNGNFSWHHAVSGIQDSGTDWWHENNEESIDYEADEHCQEDEIPEPDKDVGFFVY